MQEFLLHILVSDRNVPNICMFFDISMFNPRLVIAPWSLSHFQVYVLHQLLQKTCSGVPRKRFTGHTASSSKNAPGIRAEDGCRSLYVDFCWPCCYPLATLWHRLSVWCQIVGSIFFQSSSLAGGGPLARTIFSMNCPRTISLLSPIPNAMYARRGGWPIYEA